jgi:hypothetical protein
MRRFSPRGPAGFRRPPGGGRWLALAAVLMAVAAVLPGAAGLAILAVAVVALFLAGVVSLRAQWRAIQEEAALIAPIVDSHAVAAEVDLRLRRLREEHVTRVDAALDEGRPDEARELTDAYMDAALRVLTEGVAAAEFRP